MLDIKEKVSLAKGGASVKSIAVAWVVNYRKK
jgi:hypothetical protein